MTLKQINENERWSSVGIYIRSINTLLHRLLERDGWGISADLGMSGMWWILVGYVWLRLAMVVCDGDGQLSCCILKNGVVRSGDGGFECFRSWYCLTCGRGLRWF